MSRGTYIAFEGVDGAGKTTQARLLAQALTKERGDGSVVLVREPGGTPLGERVRAILLASDPRVQMRPRAELMLFMAARAQLAADVIEPALEAGKVVVSDRSWLSSVVYQGGLGGLGANRVQDVAHAAMGDLDMDIVVLLDVPAEVSVERVLRGKPNHFDERAATHAASLRQFYREACSFSTAATLVSLHDDGEEPEKDVHERILKNVREIMADIEHDEALQE